LYQVILFYTSLPLPLQYNSIQFVLFWYKRSILY